MNSDRRRINKIYSQIDKIASVGKDNYIQYCLYIDEIISKSEYSNFLQCLYYHYDIDIDKFVTVEEVKIKTWKEIRLVTNLDFSKKIKRLYDKKGVYQLSFDIYNDDNSLLGSIKEIDLFDDERKYYIKNRQFSKIMKTRRNYLEVLGIGSTSSTILNDYDHSISDDENLYNKYVTAINLLISSIPK